VPTVAHVAPAQLSHLKANVGVVGESQTPVSAVRVESTVSVPWMLGAVVLIGGAVVPITRVSTPTLVDPTAEVALTWKRSLEPKSSFVTRYEVPLVGVPQLAPCASQRCH
jgi:hypothetical protein